MSTNYNQGDIRSAAESLYYSINMNQQQQQQHHYNTMNQRPGLNLDLINILTADYLAGFTQDGRMSVVRRFFCFFVCFDLFFISLLWLICIMLNGQTIYDALKIQLVHYSIATSLFDVVLIAFLRCVLLIFFYAILYINHWLVIFLTTAGSCSFLITKVFYYNWPVATQPVFQVLLIIISVVLAWGEAWFFDCRVIPKEKHALRFFRAMMAENDERSPLLGAERYRSSYTASRTGGESSMTHFHSAINSRDNSDDEDNMDNNWKSIAMENFQNTYQLLESTDWTLDKTTSDGNKIYYVNRKPYGKIYRITAEIKYSAKDLYDNLVGEVEGMPQWNPTVIESRLLRKIDNHLDITYQVSAPALGGFISGRDFVNLRCWHTLHNGRIVDGRYAGSLHSLSSNSSINSLNATSKIRKSLSSTAIQNEINAKPNGLNSLHSLSQSLGARSFANQIVANAQSDDDDDAAFADAEDRNEEIASTSAGQGEAAEDKMLYLITTKGIEYERMPTNEKYERGENLIASFALRNIPGQLDSCQFEWMLCVDLKGSIPRFSVNNAMTSVMQEFVTHLRKHCDSLINSRSRNESVCFVEVHSR